MEKQAGGGEGSEGGKGAVCTETDLSSSIILSSRFLIPSNCLLLVLRNDAAILEAHA